LGYLNGGRDALSRPTGTVERIKKS
jgi:hypothetical protein